MSLLIRKKKLLHSGPLHKMSRLRCSSLLLMTKLAKIGPYNYKIDLNKVWLQTWKICHQALKMTKIDPARETAPTPHSKSCVWDENQKCRNFNDQKRVTKYLWNLRLHFSPSAWAITLFFALKSVSYTFVFVMTDYKKHLPCQYASDFNSEKRVEKLTTRAFQRCFQNSIPIHIDRVNGRLLFFCALILVQ